MPRYDYQCEKCGRIVEVTHRMSEPGPEYCGCGARGTMRRLMSAGSGLIFKGSGFYITDYARKGGSNGAGTKRSLESESSSSESESASSSSSEKSSTEKSSGEKATKEAASSGSKDE